MKPVAPPHSNPGVRPPVRPVAQVPDPEPDAEDDDDIPEDEDLDEVLDDGDDDASSDDEPDAEEEGSEGGDDEDDDEGDGEEEELPEEAGSSSQQTRIDFLLGFQIGLESEAEEAATMEKLELEEAKDSLLHLCSKVTDSGMRSNVTFFVHNVSAGGKSKRVKALTFAVFSRAVYDAIGSSLGVVRNNDIVCLSPEVRRDRAKIGEMHSWLLGENAFDDEEGAVQIDTSSLQNVVVRDAVYPVEQVLALAPGVTPPWAVHTAAVLPMPDVIEANTQPEIEDDPYKEALRSLLTSLGTTFATARRDLKEFGKNAIVGDHIEHMINARVFQECERTVKAVSAAHKDLWKDSPPSGEKPE